MNDQDRDIEAAEADTSDPSVTMKFKESPDSAIFSSFKVHTAELVGMGFPVERVQRALFWAIDQGALPDEQIDVALNLLLERGGELDSEEFDTTNASTLAAQPHSVTDPASEKMGGEAERRAAARAQLAAQPARAAPQARDRNLPGSPLIRRIQPRASAVGAAAASEVATDTGSRVCGICWDVLLPEDLASTHNLDGEVEDSLGEASTVSTNTDSDGDKSGRVAVQLGACGHVVCRECAAGWLQTNIGDGKLDLRCPLASQGLPGTSSCQAPSPPLVPPAVEALIWASCRHLTPPFKGIIPDSSLQHSQAQQAMQQAQGPPEVAAAAGAALLALSRFDGSGTTGNEGRSRRPELLNKYRRFRLQQALEGHSDILWCPALGCGAPLVKKKRHQGASGRNGRSGNPASSSASGGRRLICGACGHVVCGDCGRAYHGAAPLFGLFTWGNDAHGTSCEQATDEVLAEFSARKHLQPCPSCRRPVEKVDACPHMTCPCGHQWCWVCRGAHPCGGLHFGVDGSGSGEEIGSVWGVQRAAVAARSFSAASFPCFALLVLAIGAAIWSLSAALFLLFVVSNLVAAIVTGCRVKPMCPVDCDRDCSSEGDQACCYFVWAPCVTTMALLAPFVAIAMLYAVSGPFTVMAAVFLLVEALLVFLRWLAALCYRGGCRHTSRCLRGLPLRRNHRHRNRKTDSLKKDPAFASSGVGTTTRQLAPLPTQISNSLEAPLLENDDEAMKHKIVDIEEDTLATLDLEGDRIRDLYLLPSQLHGSGGKPDRRSNPWMCSSCCCRDGGHRYTTSQPHEGSGAIVDEETADVDHEAMPSWCPLELSALNLNLNAMDGSSVDDEGSSMNGTDSYAGVLPNLIWRSGRMALAGCVAAWLLLPTAAIACVCLPLGPLLPLPLLLNPRGRPPPRLTTMLACLGAIITTVSVWAFASWYMRNHIQDSTGNSDSSALNWFDAGVAMLDISSHGNGSGSSIDLWERVVAFAVVFMLSLLVCSAWCFRAPSSTCTCCAPLWLGALSLPLTILLGRRKAKMRINAFGPTPDLPLQLPLMVCNELATGDCCSFSD